MNTEQQLELIRECIVEHVGQIASLTRRLEALEAIAKASQDAIHKNLSTGNVGSLRGYSLDED